MKLSTGIARLDQYLEGGIEEKSNILLAGPPGVEKTVFSYHFLHAGLKNNEKAVIVYTNVNNEEIKADFAAYKLDITPYLDNIAWVDAEGLSKGKNVFNCSIAELYTVSYAIKQVLNMWKDEKIRIVFDIVSPALMMKGTMDVYKFLFELMKTLESYNATSLYLIEAGMHDSQSIISIEQLCDGIIEMTTEEDSGQVSHSLMVRRKHGSHPPEKAINFWVTEDGVQTL